METCLEEFDEYLALERGRSEHTRRAYLGDLRSLFDFLAERRPGSGLRGLTLPVLRSWLGAQASAGSSASRPRRTAHAVNVLTAEVRRASVERA
ncbi:site-specific integrase, partial [Mycobacterium sp. NAZ190054]|uniref:site-specific integrase n=1 Tax=Mycobacterium sp. NAZ190054 TaxID=1747766 RepID=UPI0018D22C6A